ncbi:MAG: sulfurtransferase, partial [Bacteroidota bacterium]
QLYLAEHLPGAHYLHLDEDLSGTIIPGVTGRHPLPEMSDFLKLLTGFGLTQNVRVVAYDDKGGGLAARLWWMLRAIGHERVQVLDGGLPAWKAAGLPTESGPVDAPTPSATPYPAPKTFLGTRDRAQVANLPADTLLIDSRTAPRYRGEQEPIDPVAGHIPGAINLPWPDNLEDGKFKSREALKDRFAGLHEEAGNNVFYCGSGVTACHNILAYDYALGGLPDLYPGSWSEYLL